MISARLYSREHVEAELRKLGCKQLAEVPDNLGGCLSYWIAPAGFAFTLRGLPPDMMVPAKDFHDAVADIRARGSKPDSNA